MNFLYILTFVLLFLSKNLQALAPVLPALDPLPSYPSFYSKEVHKAYKNLRYFLEKNGNPNTNAHESFFEITDLFLTTLHFSDKLWWKVAK